MFKEIGNEIGALVEEKNKAYGSAFQKSAQLLEILYPEGVKPSQYRDLLLTNRILDKLVRKATNNDPFGESPWIDITGYGILGVFADRRQSMVGQSALKKGMRVQAHRVDETTPQPSDSQGSLLDFLEDLQSQYPLDGSGYEGVHEGVSSSSVYDLQLNKDRSA